jgi:putative Holliday junction resolvase
MKKSIDNLNEAEISRILGIDYGQAKIGLAIADTETKMAFAFATFKNDKEFLQKLQKIIENENVKIIVLGFVRHRKDIASVREKEKFAEFLREKLKITVALQDEMFTTKMAQANIKQRGGKNIAAGDDQEAARIILQSWLDEH